MIYIFRGITECCSIPGKILSACGSLMGQLDCTACRDCCDSAGANCQMYMDRPLSTYVIIKGALALAMVGTAYMAMQDVSDKTCIFPESGHTIGITTWLQVQMAFGATHLIFAPYMQSRVWQKISDEVGVMPVDGGGPVQIPGEKVHDAFKTVFMHDFGVLFYVAIMLASFVWSYLGSMWIPAAEPPGCDTDGYSGWAYYIGLNFFWIGVAYTSCYYCCSCCSSSVELRQVPTAPGRGMPGAPASQGLMP